MCFGRFFLWEEVSLRGFFGRIVPISDFFGMFFWEVSPSQPRLFLSEPIPPTQDGYTHSHMGHAPGQPAQKGCSYSHSSFPSAGCLGRAPIWGLRGIAKRSGA